MRGPVRRDQREALKTGKGCGKGQKWDVQLRYPTHVPTQGQWWSTMTDIDHQFIRNLIMGKKGYGEELLTFENATMAVPTVMCTIGFPGVAPFTPPRLDLTTGIYRWC